MTCYQDILIITQGKTTTETFVEEHKDNNSGHLDPDFFKMTMKNLNDAEKNDITEDEQMEELKDDETGEEVVYSVEIRCKRKMFIFSVQQVPGILPGKSQ